MLLCLWLSPRSHTPLISFLSAKCLMVVSVESRNQSLICIHLDMFLQSELKVGYRQSSLEEKCTLLTLPSSSISTTLTMIVLASYELFVYSKVTLICFCKDKSRNVDTIYTQKVRKWFYI